MNIKTAIGQQFPRLAALIRGKPFIDASARNARGSYYGSVAAEYDSTREGYPKWGQEQEAVDTLLSVMPRESSILDIPVGTGRFAPFYSKYDHFVIGMDVSDDMRELARIKFKKHGVRSELRFGDILDIDLGDSAVDTAVCVRLLNLISTDEFFKALSELSRVARKSVIISIRYSRRSKSTAGQRVHSANELNRAIEAAGMFIESSTALDAHGYHIILLTKLA